MNNHITYEQITTALDVAGQAYLMVMLQNGVRLIVTQRGGRVFGPFLSAEAESLYWVNPALANGNTLVQLVEDGEWNLGGERFWIAPEIQYNVPDRSDFWGTIRVPAQMDPGNYTLEQTRDEVCLRTTMTLEAFNLASGEKDLTLERVIRPLRDPLMAVQSYSELLQDVIYAGYMQRATLQEATHNTIMSEVWNLVQLYPGGTLIIPASPMLQATRYFNTLPADAQTVQDGALRMHITGDIKYKAGYKAAYLSGRMGYLNMLDDERGYLLVRSFPNNPSSVYIEEPPDQPGENGESIHVYNDDGAMGGFGEMECHGQTIGGETGLSSSSDAFILWMYVGPMDRLKTIAAYLLGVTV